MIRKFVETVLFLFLSISISILGCEVMLRIIDESEPGQQALISKPDNIDLSFNSDGLRDREYSTSREAGAFRILVLGNSATFGVSVLGNQTYVKQLEQLLNKKQDGAFEVINAGVPAWNLLYQLKYLESKGLEYLPDLVIIGFTLNSAECHYIPPEGLFTSSTPIESDTDVLSRNAEEWSRPLKEQLRQKDQTSFLMKKWSKTKQWLSNHSALFRYIRWRYDLSKQHFDGQKDYPRALYFRDVDQHWNLAKGALRSTTDTLADRQIPLALAVFPFFIKLKQGITPDDQYMWEDIHTLLTQTGTDLGIHVIDLLNRFKGIDPRDISVDPYHMNPNGHFIAAESIYNELIRQQLIPMLE